jgi:hypothetical protein
MFQALGTLGRLLKICFAFCMAIFWGGLAYMWSEAGEFGPGMPTVIGVGSLAILAVVSGIFGLIRLMGNSGHTAPPDIGLTGSAMQAQRDLDADAMIARFEARRAAEQGGAGTDGAAPNGPSQSA